jgi:hypothetical protein
MMTSLGAASPCSVDSSIFHFLSVIALPASQDITPSFIIINDNLIAE